MVFGLSLTTVTADELDSTPLSSGTRISARVSRGITPNQWSAGVVDSDRSKRWILVDVLSPATGLVGQATLTVDTELIREDLAKSNSCSQSIVANSAGSLNNQTKQEGDEDEEEEEEEEEESVKSDAEEEKEEKESDKKRMVVRYVHTQPIYFLFNPWNESMCFVSLMLCECITITLLSKSRLDLSALSLASSGYRHIVAARRSGSF